MVSALVESLGLQLDEFDFLTATYDANELTCETQAEGGIDALRLFRDGGGDSTIPGELQDITLTYKFSLACDASGSTVRLEIQTPVDYPVHRPPVAIARSDAFTRKGGSAFGDQLATAIKGLFDEGDGSGLIFSIVQYVLEEAPAFCENASMDTVKECDAEACPAAAPEVHRAFINFHHMLYGNEHKKEQKVVDIAKSMGLSGFIAYGKPSLVCVECSSEQEVQQFISEAKRVGKEGSMTYVEKDATRKCNNGKNGLQMIKAQGKSGENPDQHAIIAVLTALGLKDKRKEITGK